MVRRLTTFVYSQGTTRRTLFKESTSEGQLSTRSCSRRLADAALFLRWLVIEPFISPALFEPFSASGSDPNGTFVAVDEWTLCEALGTNMAATIEEHYKTFIVRRSLLLRFAAIDESLLSRQTEKDFAEIAAAGLNWVRLPVPFWIVEVYDDEPFLANVGWSYFLKAITWARKYGLRLNLDLHAVPGSQNGYNHSSKLGTINFLNGVMGLANAQRTLNVIRTLTEFISQPQYRKVVPMFSIMNEPYAATIGIDILRHLCVSLSASFSPTTTDALRVQLPRDVRRDAQHWRNRPGQWTVHHLPRWVHEAGGVNCAGRMERVPPRCGSRRD